MFTGMEHGVSKRLIYCSKCTKTHLYRHLSIKKIFFRLAIARHEGRGKDGTGRRGGEGPPNILPKSGPMVDGIEAYPAFVNLLIYLHAGCRVRGIKRSS
jgi:hypothetical protein